MNLHLLGLGGLLVTAALFVPVSDYRDARNTSMEQAERRLAAFRGLSATYTQRTIREKSTPDVAQQSLFALFNSQTGEVGVSDRVEKLRPQTGRGGTDAERLEARLSGVYLDMGVNLLWALEQEKGVRIESLVLTRTAQGLLDMDIVLARNAGSS